MARGAQAKARRKEKKKSMKEELFGGGASDFMVPLEGDEMVAEAAAAAAEPEPEESEQEEEIDENLPPPPKKKKNKQRSAEDAPVVPPGMRQKKKEGIKTLPLILLIMLTGTTVLPALIYASDYFGGFLQKHNLMGSLGYKLGIGATPRKRVLSFYEKHDPSKIPDVPTIMSKHYGQYDKLIKKLERKYGDYGYFLSWEEDEAPMQLAFEQLETTREYMAEQWNINAPQPVKQAVRNIRYNLTRVYKKASKKFKKHVWPLLEPIVGVPKGGAAQKRKDAQEARKRKQGASGGSTRRKNREFRDDIEDEH